MNEDQLFLNSQLTLPNLEANMKEKLVAHMRKCFIYQCVCEGGFACISIFVPYSQALLVFALIQGNQGSARSANWLVQTLVL